MKCDRFCGFLRTNIDCSYMGFAEVGYSISNILLTSRVSRIVVKKDRASCRNTFDRSTEEEYRWGILAFLTLDLSLC